MEGETKFLSRSQFAASQGWSPSYVSKLGSQKRLVLSDDLKLVDVPATLAMLRRTEDPSKEGVRQVHASARVEKNVDTHTRPDAPDEELPRTGADPKYWDNKARREGALAELAELELAKKRASLVERERVEATAFGIARTLRDSILGLPVKLAPAFATMTDAFEIEGKLRDALRQVFVDTAQMTAEDLARLPEQSH